MFSRVNVQDPALQAASYALERSKTEDKLKRKLSNRPSLSKVEAKNIYQTEQDLKEKQQRRSSAEEVVTAQVEKMKAKK